MDLTSFTAVDTYMYLLSGAEDSGVVLASDDNGGTGNNARITHELSAGSYTIEATTNASGATGSFAVILGVFESAVPVNRAPTANAGPDQTVNTDATVTLSGSGSDPDTGDTLTYSWTQIGTPTGTISNASSTTATFTAPSSAASLTFRLTVSDGTLSDTDDITITVQAPAPAGPRLSSIRFSFTNLDDETQGTPDGNYYKGIVPASRASGYVRTTNNNVLTTHNVLGPVPEFWVSRTLANNQTHLTSTDPDDHAPLFRLNAGIPSALADSFPTWTDPASVSVTINPGQSGQTTHTFTGSEFDISQSLDSTELDVYVLFPYPLSSDAQSVIADAYVDSFVAGSSRGWQVTLNW